MHQDRLLKGVIIGLGAPGGRCEQRSQTRILNRQRRAELKLGVVLRQAIGSQPRAGLEHLSLGLLSLLRRVDPFPFVRVPALALLCTPASLASAAVRRLPQKRWDRTGGRPRGRGLGPAGSAGLASGSAAAAAGRGPADARGAEPAAFGLAFF